MATILVIHDQEPIRSLLRVALEGTGHEVHDASNGRRGLERYRERAADVIITDIVMPEMTGHELLLELTRTFLNVNVIAISGALEGEGDVGCASDVSKAFRYGRITQCPSLRVGALAGTGAL